MILLLCVDAFALDAHGPPVVPVGGDSAAAPAFTWGAGTPGTGVGVTTQYARRLAVGWSAEDETEQAVLLDNLLGFELGGAWSIGRFGVAASLPLWAHYRGEDTAYTGVSPGDLHLFVPVSLLGRPGAPSLGLRAEGFAPTGDAAALLGGGWGGGLHATAGRTGAGWTWSLGAGIVADSEAQFENVDRGVTLPVAAQVGWENERFGAGVEAWFSPSLSAAVAPLSSAPGEALARVGLRTRSGVSVGLAGGYAITPGIGSAGGRFLFRVGWARPAKVAANATPRAVFEAGPTDLVVAVRTPEGRPVSATVRAERVGAPEAAPVEVRAGRDGSATLDLSPGAWSVTVAAQGRETQSREVVIAEDAWRTDRVAVVLADDERGAGRLTVRVVDPTGAPVEAAAVSLDTVARGETGSGGTVGLDRLEVGDRTLAVFVAGYVAAEPLPVRVGVDPVDVVVVVRPEPGSVRVLARVGDHPAESAQVRFYGEGEPRAPLPLGEDGEELVQLEPGLWRAVVTAPRLGVQERDVRVEPGAVSLLRVDVRFTPEAGDASLGVRVLDPTGAPVDGAEVRLDGAIVGLTGNVGSLRVEGLAAGDHEVEASGPLLRPAPPLSVRLAGARDIDLVLGWAPGTLAVRARGPDGEPVDAAIRFAGRTEIPPARLGADGGENFTLPAGDWRVAVSADSFGLQERAVHVEPDTESRIDIEASLLREAGDATLLLTVRGPAGAEVDGARVRVDDRDAGTLGGTGVVSLGGLAPGRHRVQVEGAAEALGRWERELVLRSGENALEARLAWGARAVRVRPVGPNGGVTDAVARAHGPGQGAPEPLAVTGTVFPLDARPGWEITGSSAKWGLASSMVPAPSRSSPTEMELRFTPPTVGAARLLLDLRDPAGRPVVGAAVTVDGEEIAAPGGLLLLPEREPGAVPVRVAAPGYTPTEEALVLVEGPQERRVRLQWRPRPLVVIVVDDTGAPVDAEVRLAGPRDIRAGASGATGRVSADVLPGDWQVLVSAAAFGARSVDAPVAPGEGPVEVTIRLGGARVAVTEGAVRLDDAIHFAFDEATIQPDSFGMLEEVAGALLLHPELTRIEIQGHTDDRGEAVYNLDLSQRRADSVRTWLVAHGVAVERLVARGFGSSVPVATNGTDVGRSANRRVQVVILERRGE